MSLHAPMEGSEDKSSQATKRIQLTRILSPASAWNFSIVAVSVSGGFVICLFGFANGRTMEIEMEKETMA